MTPMDRRRFLKITAVTGTTAALSACGSPEQQIVRFIPDDDIVPGIAEWKPSVCPLCAAGCGVLARVMDGDAEVFRNGAPGIQRRALVKKLEGDPAHPLSQGRLCVRGQAGVQVTYHPDRLVAPMKRTGDRGTGAFAEISWDEALGTLVTRLDGTRSASGGARIAYLGRPRRGRRAEVVTRFLRGLGGEAPVWFEPFDDTVLRRANALSFGKHQLPTFDLARSRYLLNFGADLLGTWNSPLAHGVAYGRMRQGQPGVRPKFVQIEPRVSQTGASADEWVAVRPGTEGAVALGLAHVILAKNLRPAAAGGAAGAHISGWSSGLAEFAPDAVEKLSGIAAARLERLAVEFASYGPAVAAVGGLALAQTNGLEQALAVNALNALVGAVGAPGGLHFTPIDASTASPSDLHAYVQTSTPGVLFLDGANPLFSLPPSSRVAEWLAAIPFVVSVDSFIDDTSAQADLILPDHSFLESWVESSPESGSLDAVRTVAPPAMRPLYDTRSTPDVLLDVSRRLAQPLDPPLPWQTFDELLQADTIDASPTRSPAAPRRSSAVSEAAAPRTWTPPAFDGAASEFPLHFLPYASQAFVDGSLAHLPWLQELPDPLTTAMWSAWVEINPHTAAAAGIADGDLVQVTSAHGTLQAPAVLSPGIGPDAVAMPAGQGHGTFTRYASGRGSNPFGILAPSSDGATGRHAWGATRVKIAKAAPADGSLILFGGATRERPEHTRGRG
jgi:menaquinone reductase, molybdopterin-binding-like subunit